MDWGIDFSSGGIIKNDHNVWHKILLLGIYLKETIKDVYHALMCGFFPNNLPYSSKSLK